MITQGRRDPHIYEPDIWPGGRYHNEWVGRGGLEVGRQEKKRRFDGSRSNTNSVRVLSWERTPTIEEMARMEAGLCACVCGALSASQLMAGPVANIQKAMNSLKSVNGEPVLVIVGTANKI